MQDGGRLLLTIEHASMEDAGDWALELETPTSSLETRCKVTVVELPKMEHPKPQEFELPALVRVRQRNDSSSSTSGSSSKRSRQVEEGEAPKFHRLLEDLCTREGENVVLSVTSTTVPQPSVLWFRNGMRVERTNSNYIIKSDQGLFGGVFGVILKVEVVL